MTAPVGMLGQHPPAALTSSDGTGNRRSACDRCRSHKLRCDRDQDASQCRRCLKAYAECVTSAALKSGRPLQANITNAHQFYQEQQHEEDYVQSSVQHGLSSFRTPPHTTFEVPFGAIPNDVDGDIDMQPLVLPSNFIGFDDMWTDGVDQAPIPDQPSNGTNTNLSRSVSAFCGPLDPHYECFTKLGDLQKTILADLQVAKLCRTAPACLLPPTPPSDPSSPGQSFLVGRMFDHSKALLAILNTFDPVSTWDIHEDVIPDRPPGLRCDIPTLVSLISAYVCLVRIYRIILSCILESMPFLLNLPPPVPQLFPGINLAGFSLETRLDLQVQILVQVSEDMISKIEAKFGMVVESDSDRLAGGGTIFPPENTAKMLRMIMLEEANEQPLVNDPRGPCGALRDVIGNLKGCLQRKNGKNKT